MHALADMRGALRDWTEVGPEKSTSWGCKHPPRIVQYNRDKYTKGERKIQSRIKARNKTNWGVDLSGVLIFFLFPFLVTGRLGAWCAQFSQCHCDWTRCREAGFISCSSSLLVGLGGAVKASSPVLLNSRNSVVNPPDPDFAATSPL